MKLKFLGDLKQLEKCVLRTGIPGKWREHENRQKQYRTDDGAMLSWWESTKTLLFEGQKPAIPKLKRAFVKVATKKGLLVGRHDLVDEITDLPSVISEIAKLSREQRHMRVDAAKLKRRQKRMRIEIAELKEGRS
jgi:hypothetical protein